MEGYYYGHNRHIKDRILFIMARMTTTQHPAVQRLLRGLGQNLRLARQRRRFTAALLADRAGMSRTTLRAIERGDAGVTLGSYANVLHCLGLEEDLGLLARDDELGRKLQDAGLPERTRAPRKRPQ
jgi:DNA-binding XRE family transcriptional regulator